jgi:KUP system potassium uptake protein
MSSTPTNTLSQSAKVALTIGALGVVFGDIGTSPLYTMNECIKHLPAGVTGENGVLGVLSLIFWSLFLIVSVKYLFFITRADNHGEGGIFALLALIHAKSDPTRSNRRGLGPAVVMILVGAALLYGDGIITPAISVLGAAEGFNAISPAFSRYVPWMACFILAALFWFQCKGTKSIGAVFGPVMLVWFAALAVLGGWQIAHHPGVLRALNPAYGLALFATSPGKIATLLGSVVLAVTGAEALYADLGHFGRRSIAWAWYGAAFPGLALNYFGQGAYSLAHPGTDENPFFALAPEGFARAALTGLSIVAAVIASQALISGAYSLTQQAIQLGYFPRLKIIHTNAEQSGQIYLPFVNALLAIGSILTVAAFRSSDALASAYGIAVTGTMAITTVAFYIVTRRLWNWPVWRAAPLCGFFLVVDSAFFIANTDKLADGGWFPLAIGAALLAVMHTWKIGRDSIFQVIYTNNITEAELTRIAGSPRVTRVPGCAVFMAGSPQGTPIALLHHVKANRCLHKTVVLLSVITEDVPTVADDRRMALTQLGQGIWRAIGHYGYMESPDAAELMAKIEAGGVPGHPGSATFFFNREMVITGGNSRMWEWQKSLYGFLSRNARPAKDYYRIPPAQIIEIGLPVQL